MTHASLFSGIGGFDLAARWAGWENLFNCEINPFCQTVLKYHFPDAEQYSDIRTTDFTLWRGRIDVLSGGFPCQPFSVAGKRKGTEDERHLWPEMLRAIREIQPYVLPACGVGAPRRRYRTWFVAHRTDSGIEGLRGREDGVYAAGTTADSRCNGRIKGQMKLNLTSQRGRGLTALATNGLLPTPTTNDKNNNPETPSQTDRNNLAGYMRRQGLTHSQLNPQFVAEMMGFPPDWTELPFQNGEPKALKASVTR